MEIADGLAQKILDGMKQDGWVDLEVSYIQLKHTLWNYSNLRVVCRTDFTVCFITREIQSRYGRIEEVSLFQGDHTLPFNRIRNMSQKIGDLLQTFGSSNKETPEKYMLYYDFEPYNGRDPVLLAL